MVMKWWLSACKHTLHHENMFLDTCWICCMGIMQISFLLFSLSSKEFGLFTHILSLSVLHKLLKYKLGDCRNYNPQFMTHSPAFTTELFAVCAAALSCIKVLWFSSSFTWLKKCDRITRKYNSECIVSWKESCIGSKFKSK